MAARTEAAGRRPVRRKPATSKIITRTALTRETKQVMEDMEASQQPVVVMYRGRPEAIIQPINVDKLAELITANAAALVVAERAAAFRDLDQGRAATSAEVFGD